MNRFICIAALLCLLTTAGCGGKGADVPLQTGEATAVNAFVSGMGCSDPSCTDASHHHDCPADCEDYNHYHSCAPDCTETQHHHAEVHHDDAQPASPASVESVAFISGMGCSDPSCTDPSHHHDCPADCEDYSHYHNCSLDCTEAQHHHAEAHHDDAQQVSPAVVESIAFVSGMGCSDPNCTDASHHHDCPADCGDYSHYHSCTLDCAEAGHHHSEEKSGGDSHHHGSDHH